MDKEQKTWSRYKTFQILYLALMSILLIAPLLQMNFPVFPDLPGTENRRLADRPVLEKISTEAIHDYLGNFERYFNDRLGFKNTLTRITGFVNVKLLGVSPIPQVMVGKSDWLFLNIPQFEVSLFDYYGLSFFDRDQYLAVRKSMRAIRHELNSRNIMFLFVIAPSKHTIYAEYLPGTLGEKKGGVSRTDQVVDIWGNDSPHDRLIDLRAVLLDAKKTEPYPLYFKTDTHWNDLGAFLGYSEIIKKIQERYPQTKALTIKDFDIEITDNRGNGDMARMINIAGYLTDRVVTLKPRLPGINSKSMKKVCFKDRKNAEPTLPRKVLIFGDSFSNKLAPYLSSTFINCRRYKSGAPTAPKLVDLAAINREKPDIVILEITERFLFKLILTDLIL